MKERKQLSLVILVTGIALFFSYQIYYHFIDVVSDNLINDYYKNNMVKEDKNAVIVKKINNKKEDKEEYLGILTIPKINLNEGFYSKNSKKNNVSNSVTLLNESIMPDKDNSIIYLAAHSGRGFLAFFKDINKLTNNDMLYINYNGNIYSYIISDIYEMPKNGEIIVDRNINEKSLVLTTCSNNKNMQLVIVSKMISEI